MLRLATQSAKGAILECSQQFRLGLQRHVTNLIQKKRAGIGLLKLAFASFAISTGEAAALVTKKLTLDQRGRQRCGIDHHHIAV